MTGVVSIDQVHSLCYYIASKQLQAFPSPAEFNQYANLANIDLFNYYNDKRLEELIKVKQGESLYVPPVLATFVQYNVALSQSGNVLTQPNGYLYDLQMTSASVNLFKKADYDKVANYLNSTIDTPTNTNPIFVELSDTFIAYPSTVSSCQLTYLSQPNTVVWNYSLVNGRPVYNPIGSVDYQWDSTEVYRITARVLKYMGIAIRDGELAQAANEMIQTSN